MKQTSLQGIANKATQDKTYRFRNLFGLLTVGYLFWCWDFINKKASAGVDRIDAQVYEANLLPNIDQLVQQVKAKTYRAKLILRKYIPKTGGKLRPLGIPAIADKLLQTGVAKILEAIYEQDFLNCSYGYRPKRSVHQAVKELSSTLQTGQYHHIVEADIKSYFNTIDHELLLEMLAKRIDDKPFLNLIRKWLKAGILETDGQVIHPITGTPQGGVVSAILANIYLHHVIDEWFEETVRKHCSGQVYYCRYCDDFVCAFQHAKDAKRFYEVLSKRLTCYGSQVAEDKTRIIEFSHCKARAKSKFDFLGFEFRWGVNRWGKPTLKRRTSREKLRASLAKFKVWFRKYSGLPKETLFTKLNRKLRGYYNFYGIRGNSKSLGRFAYHVGQLFYKWLNRRSQRKSYNVVGFKALLKDFELIKPRICHDF